MTVATTLAQAVAMWMLMMTAMMLPGTIPAIRLHARLYEGSGSIQRFVEFTGGYLLTWFAYSILGAGLQVFLDNSGLLNLEGKLGAATGSAILVGAGFFQFSALKESCLSKCRNPLTLFLSNWQNGPTPSLTLGLRHGLYCVGCCWALMALGFVVGLMNLLWMAAIALIVTAEKLLPAGRTVGRVAGLLLIGWGIARL